MAWLRDFYFGTEHPPGPEAAGRRTTSTRSTPPRSTRSSSATTPTATRSSSSRAGTGPTSSGARTPPACPRTLAPDELTLELALELLAAPKGDEPIGVHDGLPVFAKNGRFGPYVQWGDAEAPPPGCDQAEDGVALQDDDARAHHASTTPSSCCRSLGWSASIRPTARRSSPPNGRYGPYVQQGQGEPLAGQRGAALRRSRSTRPWRCWPSPGSSAAAAAPRPSRRCASSAPTRSSQRPVVAKEGRFGVYVTDGETNASLGQGDRLEEMSPERAFELLAIRREQVGRQGPAARKARSKKAAKPRKKADEEGHRRPAARPDGAPVRGPPPATLACWRHGRAAGTSPSRAARPPASRPRPAAWPSSSDAVLTREPGGTPIGQPHPGVLPTPPTPS